MYKDSYTQKNSVAEEYSYTQNILKIGRDPVLERIIFISSIFVSSLYMSRLCVVRQVAGLHGNNVSSIWERAEEHALR